MQSINKIEYFLVISLIVLLANLSISNNLSHGQDNTQDICNTNLQINDYLAVGDDGDEAIPSNAFDNNLGTRWSHEGVGSWIQIDLGKPKIICSVDIAWYKGNERSYNFVILASNSGSNFIEIFESSSSGTTLLPEKYALIDESSTSVIKARYLMIKVNGNVNMLNEDSTWSAITEIDLFGK